MAAAMVLIYAGAILITYVFVIMLASEAVAGSPAASEEFVAAHDGVSRDPFIASIVGFAVAGLLIFVIFDKSHGASMAAKAQTTPASVEVGATVVEPAEPKVDLDAMASTQALGEELIDHQAINVQLAGVILTLAMVGAITLARRKVILSGGDRPVSTETMNTPHTPVDDNPHSIPVYGTTNPRQKEYPEN
jgi:NADH-quinone oxidoreductase subunit J